jgi:hypothetical protein
MTINQLLGVKIRRFFASKGYVVERMDHLTYLADHFGSDKGTQSSAHFYTRIYTRLFQSIRNEVLTVAEIGLHRRDVDMRCIHGGNSELAKASAAPSLEMWKAYFPNADIFGFDIDDFSKVKIDRCSIVRGDMSSRNDLAGFVHTIGRPIDILIEDGSHTSHHQQIAFGYLFRYIRPGGMYIIEDLHWQDKREERNDSPKTRDILRRFQANGVIRSPYFTGEETAYIQENLKKVHLFDSSSLEVEDPTDALGVMVKK